MRNTRPEERKTWAPHYRGKNRLKQRKQWPTGPKANSIHAVESLRRRTSCCCCCFAVVPSESRACLLQFSNDWQISYLGRSRKAKKRQDQRQLPAPLLGAHYRKSASLLEKKRLLRSFFCCSSNNSQSFSFFHF